MIELEPGHVPAAVERLIPERVPTRPRFLAVIDGVLTGRLWTDDPHDPTWAVAVEIADGTVYAGGAVDRIPLTKLLRGLETASRELVFGFVGADDPLRRVMPPGAEYHGEAIDFTDRLPSPDEEVELGHDVAEGARVVPIDTELLPRTQWYEDTLVAYGNVERWAEAAIGYAVVRGDQVVAEAMAGPRVRGQLEMGVATREPYRRRGYGTLVSRLVARTCEARGDRVWWNANAANESSVAIARRIGFQHERRYELVGYRVDGFAR
jgi:RimJ/RimL family protein N-acetyltransferase